MRLRMPAFLLTSVGLVTCLLLASSVFLAAPSLALPGDTGNLSFDWTMPTRYATNANQSGAVSWGGTAEVRPAGFRVDLSAQGCGGGTIRWLIEGMPVTAGDVNVVGGSPNSCSLSYQFPREASYEVSVEEHDANGELVSRATNIVPVQDLLIVSIGDSVASGEGNPDVPLVPTWQNEQCHRSAQAGPSRAAQTIEAADARTSVTFVHLACSGATITEGLLGPYAGIEPGGLLPSQVSALQDLVGDREIDALLVSIGANDVKFSNLVMHCFVSPIPCDANVPGSSARLFDQRLPGLPGRYDQLDAALDDLPVAADQVYLTEYYDPTRDEAGQLCDRTILGDHPASLASQHIGISAAEAGWASNVMLTSLNAEVASAASRHGWRFVGGIASQFLTHGYCADDAWVVRWQESKVIQGDQEGTLHPNGDGQQVYANRINATLMTDLYPNGNQQAPRRPEQRLELLGSLDGGPFVDVVGPVTAGSTVRVRARVAGPDNIGRNVSFALDGPGSLSATSGTTDANGEITFTYNPPAPGSEDRSRVVAVLVDGDQTYRDTVGIALEVTPPTPTPTPTSVQPPSGDRHYAGPCTNFNGITTNVSDIGIAAQPSGTYTMRILETATNFCSGFAPFCTFEVPGIGAAGGSFNVLNPPCISVATRIIGTESVGATSGTLDFTIEILLNDGVTWLQVASYNLTRIN